MWVFLWIVLSAILIGATLWSLQILLRQKAAWEQYAKTKKFTFNRGTFMGPAEMSGVIGDYKVSFFTAERPGVDVRTKRYVTVMEIDLIDGLVDGGVAGTAEMLTFMQSLDKLHPLKIDHPAWEEGLFSFVRHDEVTKAFFTAPRAEALVQILKTKNADVLFMYNDKEVVIRLETSDPMQNADKIDKIVKRTIGLCERLRITPEQRESIMALADV